MTTSSDRSLPPRPPTVRLVAQALRLAARDAAEEYRRAGQLMAVWQDGRVVLVPPPPTAESVPARRRTRP